MKKTLSSLVTAAIMSVSFIGGTFASVDFSGNIDANAAESYPVQEIRLAMADTDNNVASNGNSLAPSVMTGTDNEKWSLNYISDGVYEIVNSASGKILTANGSGVTLAPDTDAATQRWKIEGVQKDFEGYMLYYKITSNADSSKALTYTEGAGFGLSGYSGDTYQKYKINLDGLEGFAANAKVSGGEKAGTIGGLLGKTVYVNTVEDMVAAMKDTNPLTIVVNANLDFKDWDKMNQKIEDDKTIVGSYSANNLYDLQWRTDDFYGDASKPPSNNIVVRNINVTSRTLNGKVMIQVYSTRNIWVDHCTFNNTLDYDRMGNGLDEVGKFIWINTPSMGWTDDAYNGISPDYITISYCSFNSRYWTVAYGTQNTETTRCRTTLLYNNWTHCVRRTPQIGNGTGHIYNNYFEGYDNGNGSGTAQIIGGDGSDVVSENNRFQAFTQVQALSMGGVSDPARDSGSYLSSSSSVTPDKISFVPKTVSTLYPNKTNYGYSLLYAYKADGKDTKKFTQTYAGCFKSKSGIKYITDSDMSDWIQTKYDSPFLKHVEFSSASSAVFDNGSVYRIKNVNSGLYMQVEGAKAENGANVQQWGTSDGITHDIWKLIDAGDGYYYLASAVGDGGTYMLDISGKKSENGTNVDIYKFNGGDNQKFMITQNADGSYKIRTKVTNGKSAIEIANASNQSGANVQQWEINGVNCQDWIFEEVSNPGCKMNTDVVYEFENVNSGMVMDIESGKTESGTNIQQWSTGHFKSQQWLLKEFTGGGNYYYICSYSNPSYVLRADGSANGANISIAEYSTKDSAMLFKFSKNPDGTYYIMTRASKDACLVEIESASTVSGANVQQWSPTNNNCQKWSVDIMTTTTTKPATTTTTVQTTETTPVTTENKPLKGDLNNDGIVNVSDIIILEKYLLGIESMTSAQLYAADLDNNNIVEVFDMVPFRKLIISK
ncbi:MAG: RICIN domain-containing protein [Ruminococcus sp.]|nr:RICIN domain-containing protein [Ruminococcus sp.]